MINNLNIYGERNSGTNYLETVLTGKSRKFSRDYYAFNIPLARDYGYKHFFGYHTKQIKNKGDHTLFIGIVRNPYDWIVALSITKHQVPKENHDIKNFLTNEWYSVSTNPNDHNYGLERMDDRDFDTGLRYQNIFALRSKKLRYLYETMPTIAKNYELIKYEVLCKNPLLILESWSDKYNLELNKNFIQPIAKEPYKIEPEIKKIIDENIDWEIENQVGYFRK